MVRQLTGGLIVEISISPVYQLKLNEHLSLISRFILEIK